LIELNLSSRFTNKLLSTILHEDDSTPPGDNNNNNENSYYYSQRKKKNKINEEIEKEIFNELTLEKRQQLWKFLQKKQMQSLIFKTFQFFQILKRKIHLREKYSYLSYYGYQRPLLLNQPFIQWKRHFHDRQKKAMDYYQNYYQKWCKNIFFHWKEYFLNKYSHRLLQLNTWQYDYRLQQTMKNWKFIYEQMNLIRNYQFLLRKKMKKFLFYKWKKIHFHEKLLKKKISFLWKEFFYKKYFHIWFQKVK
jgi:hypothetical protein